MCFNALRCRGRLTKLGKKDVTLIADIQNAEFTDNKDTCQNPQDKEESNKANSAIVLKSAPAD